MLVWPLWDYPHDPDRKRPTSGRGTKWHVSPADRTGRAKKKTWTKRCARFFLGFISQELFSKPFMEHTWVSGGVKKVCLFSMFIFSIIHPSHCFHCLIVAIYFCCFKGPLAIAKCDVSHCFCVLEKINKETSRTNSVLGNVHVMVCLHEFYMDSLLCSGVVV